MASIYKYLYSQYLHYSIDMLCAVVIQSTIDNNVITSLTRLIQLTGLFIAINISGE